MVWKPTCLITKSIGGAPTFCTCVREMLVQILVSSWAFHVFPQFLQEIWPRQSFYILSNLIHRSSLTFHIYSPSLRQCPQINHHPLCLFRALFCFNDTHVTYETPKNLIGGGGRITKPCTTTSPHFYAAW